VTVNPAVNIPPTANAGLPQTVVSGNTATLNGTASIDADGTIASYAWTQTAGPAVTLSSTTAVQPTFTAPVVTPITTLTFSLVVTDNQGATSAASTVNVTVNPATNIAPTANAGPDETVVPGQTVAMAGQQSSDPDGSVAGFAWTQTAGPAVTLSSSTMMAVSFTAPTVSAVTVLTFSLVVTDNRGAASAPDTVNITVDPAATADVNITGRVRFARVVFATSGLNPPLNYASPVMQPSRAVIVRALNSNSQVELAQGRTDANGDYSLSVPRNTSVTLRVEARSASTGGSPSWDVRVQNGTSGNTPYAFLDGPFNSASGVARNIDIPTGINASGVATGTRASGPFAALDTVYQGMQLILGVAPQTNFPALIIDWGAQSDGTFFSGSAPQHIALLSNLASDTDEFDQHVVAHEFGHYIEHNFSRADNIGGPHGLGDRLDIRVAFGEGFGYAFAAIVLNNTNARDSYVDNGTHRSSGFNIDTNPSGDGTVGCWCSESSVWSVLYDFYDSGIESGDQVALGFGPIWSVLTGAQRTTPAFTSIFSFGTALKAANPADAPGISTLLLLQNITATPMDEWGSTENNASATVPTEATFPFYTVATVNGGPVVMRTVNDAGTNNKLGNHRYVRFNNASQRNVTVTLATSNPNADPDPDFFLWSGLNFIGASTSAPPGPEVRQFTNLPAGNYVIDAYDCANGCNPAEGTAGDYDLTVTITSP
jgi:hypothetical protein